MRAQVRQHDLLFGDLEQQRQLVAVCEADRLHAGQLTAERVEPVSSVSRSVGQESATHPAFSLQATSNRKDVLCEPLTPSIGSGEFLNG